MPVEALPTQDMPKEIVNEYLQIIEQARLEN